MLKITHEIYLNLILNDNYEAIIESDRQFNSEIHLRQIVYFHIIVRHFFKIHIPITWLPSVHDLLRRLFVKYKHYIPIIRVVQTYLQGSTKQIIDSQHLNKLQQILYSRDLTNKIIYSNKLLLEYKHTTNVLKIIAHGRLLYLLD